MDSKEIFNSIVAALGAYATWLFGGWDTALIVLVLFIVLDFATGLLKAIVNKELSSAMGFKGLAKKAVIFVILIVAVSLDRLSNTGTWMFRTLVAYFYISNEGISILENSIALGLPVPAKLKDTLLQFRKDDDAK